jgi:hypothetical protein
MSGQSYTRIFWDTNGEYIGHGMLFLSNRNSPEDGYFDVKKEEKVCQSMEQVVSRSTQQKMCGLRHSAL